MRYTRNCHPDDLWTRYFTSSTHVAIQRWLYGEPDVIEVRRIFSNKKDAIDWEFKVIQRIKAIKKPCFLNCGNQGKFFCSKDKLTEEHKKKISQSHKGKTLSKEHKEKISCSLKNKPHDESRRRRVLSEEHKKKISQSNKGRPGRSLSDQHLQMLKNRTGENNPMFGKKIPKEVVKKRIDKMKPKVSGKSHWMFGKSYSDEYKQKMSESLKASWARRKLNQHLELSNG